MTCTIRRAELSPTKHIIPGNSGVGARLRDLVVLSNFGGCLVLSRARPALRIACHEGQEKLRRRMKELQADIADAGLQVGRLTGQAGLSYAILPCSKARRSRGKCDWQHLSGMAVFSLFSLSIFYRLSRWVLSAWSREGKQCGTIRGHHITTPHATQHPCLSFALCLTKDRLHISLVHANSSILLLFFLTAEMDVPSTFNRAICYSVPQHQRTTFDRAVAGLPIDFSSYPVTGEVFGSKAECKARLQGFALSQGFAVVVSKSS
jgi:hypothetical protein